MMKSKIKKSILKDPRDLYPSPPFEIQDQEWPGLASKMKPVPDHGEKSYTGSGKLLGRKALITGGDSGIGRAAAIAYAREGADVAISYLPQEESDALEVKKLIEAEGRIAIMLPGDIRFPHWCREMVETAVEQLGGLDILVNNAARQKSVENLLDISDEDFDWTIKTNIYAPFWITKKALEFMPAGSSIINTTSIVSVDPPVNLKDYSITKAGILNFTKSLAKEAILKGIRVNAVAPGPVWTPLQTSGGQSVEKYTTFGEDSLLERPGQPVELAGVFVFLASTDSSDVTSQVYGITSGKPLI